MREHTTKVNNGSLSATAFQGSQMERDIRKEIFEVDKTGCEAVPECDSTFGCREEVVVADCHEVELVHAVAGKGIKCTDPSLEQCGSQVAYSSTRHTSRDADSHIPEPPVHVELDPTMRKHVRSFIEERPRSVYELKDFKSLLLCLSGITTALSCMSKAGFVHRYVSVGNSHFCEGRGILSDFEYVKEYGKISASDPKTGTPGFMAVEYQAKGYLFLPDTELSGMATADGSDLMDPPFIPNPVHDLESVFWQYLWFLHYRMPCNLVAQKKPSELLQALSTVSGSAYNLFSHGIDGHTTRQNLITLPRGQRSLLKGLLLINGVELLEPYDLTGKLRNEYKRVEEATPEVVNGRLQFSLDTFKPDIYNTFKHYFQRALDYMEQGGDFSVEDSSVARDRLARAQTGASTPLGSPTAGSSRPSTRQTLSTSAGKSRGSRYKRLREDACLDDRDQEQETSRSLKKRKSSEQAGLTCALRSGASATKVGAAPAEPSAAGKTNRKPSACGSETERRSGEEGLEARVFHRGG